MKNKSKNTDESTLVCSKPWTVKTDCDKWRKPLLGRILMNWDVCVFSPGLQEGTGAGAEETAAAARAQPAGGGGSGECRHTKKGRLSYFCVSCHLCQPWGGTFSGVYVPCIYSHARWSYRRWFRSLLLCPLPVEGCSWFALCWFYQP